MRLAALALVAVSCGGGEFTTAPGGGAGGPALDDPTPGALGGAEAGEGASGGAKSSPGGSDASGGATGGADASGGSSGGAEPSAGGLDASGGATGGADASGGASGGAGAAPPYEPASCPSFVCGTLTLTGSAGEVYCWTVAPNSSTAGNLIQVGEGACMATLDGAPENFSDGIPGGRLLIWGCDFNANCY